MQKTDWKIQKTNLKMQKFENSLIAINYKIFCAPKIVKIVFFAI